MGKALSCNSALIDNNMHLAIAVLNEVQNLCLKFAVVDSLGPRYRCGIGSVQHIELLVRPKEGIKRTAGCLHSGYI